MTKYNFKWGGAGFAASCALVAISCGGGSTNEGIQSLESQTSEVFEGTFIDSPVEGLEYVSGRVQGVTDGEGRFKYENGSTIQFKIGSVVLGEGIPREIMTPDEIVDGEGEVGERRLNNLLRLLQTLDSDANPDNGIELDTESLRDRASGIRDLPLDLSEEEFELNDDVRSLVAPLRRRMVSTDAARHHFDRNSDRMKHDEEVDGLPGIDLFERDVDIDEQFDEADEDQSDGLNEEEFCRRFIHRLKTHLLNFFMRIDIDDNRLIDFEEALHFARTRDFFSLEALKRAFARFDQNDDRFISYDEFLDGMLKRARRRCVHLFNRLDKDEDGIVTREEFWKCYKRYRPSRVHRWRIFKSKDKDNDGFLNLEEFLAGVRVDRLDRMENIFHELDQNDDGLLSFREVAGFSEDEDLIRDHELVEARYRLSDEVHHRVRDAVHELENTQVDEILNDIRERVDVDLRDHVSEEVRDRVFNQLRDRIDGDSSRSD